MATTKNAKNIRRNLALSRETVKLQQDTINELLSTNEGLRDTVRDRDALATHLRTQLGAKVDTSMVEARTKLAAQLGQMMEAMTRAIGYLIAKEQI